MPKKSTEISLLEKAKSHKVKRQMKKRITDEVLEVYIAYFNGEIDISQACFALQMASPTFRGNAGSVIRDAIVAGKIDELELIGD